MSDVLKNGGYIDVPMWGKTKNEKGESFFPQRFSTEQYLKIKK